MAIRLSHQDFDACSRVLRELYAESSLQKFPARLLSLLLDLVPSSHASWNAADERQGVYSITYCPERPELKALLPQFTATIHTSPLFDHFRTGATFPKKTSDVMTFRQFKETPAFREFYRFAGTKHQMIFSLPREKLRISLALALNRPHRDFSERDRAVLTFLSPHIAQAYKNARIALETVSQMQTVSEGLDCMRRAIILAGTEGSIYWQSELAREWLKEFFPNTLHASEQLPPNLKKWLGQVEKSAPSNRPVFSELQLPASNRQRLLVYCSKIRGQYVIVLMRERMEIDLAAAQSFGLTSREAEILFWISEAKTRLEIAEILGVSWRTVAKHMEHIFTKLNVENRLEAQRIGSEIRKM